MLPGCVTYSACVPDPNLDTQEVVLRGTERFVGEPTVREKWSVTKDRKQLVAGRCRPSPDGECPKHFVIVDVDRPVSDGLDSCHTTTTPLK